MPNSIKRCLALILALTLCTTGVPASAVAEAEGLSVQTDIHTETQETSLDAQPTEGLQPETQTPEAKATELRVFFRTHTVGDPSWNGDEGWSSYESSQSSEEGQDSMGQEAQGSPEELDGQEALDGPVDQEAPVQELLPFDSLEMRVSDLGAAGDKSAATKDEGATAGDNSAKGEGTATEEADAKNEAPVAGDNSAEGKDLAAEETNASSATITYRIRNANGEWQDTWTDAPNAATCEQAITGVQAKLSDELSTSYDLWYRAKDESGAWMDWVLANNELQTSDHTPLYDFQAVLTTKDHTPEESANVGSRDEKCDEEPDASSTGSSAETEGTATDVQPQSEATTTQDPKASIEVTESKPSPSQKTSNKISTNSSNSITVVNAAQTNPSIAYRAHVQSIGWQSWVKNGAMAGTSGMGLRVEGFYFRLKNADGGLSCSAHVQSIGWQDPVGSNKLVGTKGKSLRVEAIKLSLTGNIAQTHDIYYRAHVQSIGWQKWVKNGKIAGTSGKSLRIEAIEVLLVRKGGTIPTNDMAGKQYTDGSKATAEGIHYQSYVKGKGWRQEVSNGGVCGIADQSTYIDALRATVSGVDGGISYRTYLQNSGWTKWSKNGAVSGAAGKPKKIEAIKIKLTGNARKTHDVCYRVYAQNVGWMGWTKNGASAGSNGFGYGIEAVQIRLVKKGFDTSSSDGSTTLPYFGDITVTYSSRSNIEQGWQDTKKDGSTSGTVGQSGRIDLVRASLVEAGESGIRYSVCSSANAWQQWESNDAEAGKSGENLTALRFELTGILSEHYDVWYRVHIAKFGWLGWTKNGNSAGSDSAITPIEAFEIRILRKGSDAPGSTLTPFKYARRLNGVDISGHNLGVDVSTLEADFVIIKATEGVTGSLTNPAYYNPSYKTWANQALAKGKLVGFYHYANGGDPIKEADWFYYAIKDYKGRAIACLDWEGQGNDLFGSGQDVTWCKKFLNRLKKKMGGTPLLYTSKNETNVRDWSSVAKSYPLWGAQYPDYEPVYGYLSEPWQSRDGWGAWGAFPLIFQYSGSGYLKNAGKWRAFDLDLFYGTVGDWKNLQK